MNSSMDGALKNKVSQNSQDETEMFNEPTLDEAYMEKSMLFFKEALKKGMDVAQLANGDLMVTETRIHTYRYHWDDERKRFGRSTTATRKVRDNKNV